MRKCALLALLAAICYNLSDAQDGPGLKFGVRVPVQVELQTADIEITVDHWRAEGTAVNYGADALLLYTK